MPETARRLAAILCPDVVGWSGLVGTDAAAAPEALRATRLELVDPAIAGRSGRISKTTGDGLLAEFASVVEALRAALAIQAGIRERGRARADGAAIGCGRASS